MADFAPDPRLDESKRVPMEEVLDRLGVAGLKRQGAEMVGPCPVCGGRDRFAVNLRSHLALCRKCGLKSGDQVGLVRAVQGVGFRDALAWLMGSGEIDLDPRKAERRRARARAEAERQQREADRRRDWAIELAGKIWKAAGPNDHPALTAYLRGRGFTDATLAALPPSIRCAPDHKYRRKIDDELVLLHRGPAMIARIVSPSAPVCGVHQTWLDPDRPGKKARVDMRAEDNGGAPWPAKIVMGTAKGGVIPLTYPARKAGAIVIGEGIETTLTALQVDSVPGANYWAGVSLGNIAGRMQKIPGVCHSGVPDLSDARAFVPPAWCTKLVLIQDGDSDPKATRARLLAGARRAMALRPGLQAFIVHPGGPVDLNDLIQPKEPSDV